jgi:hypothetical protein
MKWFMENFHIHFVAGWNAFKFWDTAVVAIFALFCVIIYRLDRDDTSPFFRFREFFTSGDWNGKPSVARLGYFGAFLSHSLMVTHRELTTREGISAEMASLYALIWSGAYVALKAIDMKAAQTATPSSSTTISTTSTTTGDLNANVPRA